MVDDSKNLKDKIFAYKGLGMIGSADIIGAAITGIFWLSIASLIDVKEYGELHYFMGIAGLAYVITLIGTQNTVTVYSAKKINGVRLYKLARKNKTIDRKPVEVNIIDLTLNDIQDKQIDFSVTCSKGTYIRVLGQEIAKKLGTEGHLTKLQRIAVGDFVVQDSIPLKEFEAKWMSTEH